MARDFKDWDKDFMKRASLMLKDMPHVLDDIGMAGEELFTDNFRREGFLDVAVEMWPKRKVLDGFGRSRIRYRTKRVGRAGSLNKYGRSIKGRSLLVKTDKLRGSIRYKKRGRTTIVFSSKSYGRYHNEGTEHLRKRQFMGRSKALENEIKDIIDQHMEEWMR